MGELSTDLAYAIYVDDDLVVHLVYVSVVGNAAARTRCGVLRHRFAQVPNLHHHPTCVMCVACAEVSSENLWRST